MITVTIKGRISNVRFLEAQGAKKVKIGQYYSYQMIVADENAARKLDHSLTAEGDMGVWTEWTTSDFAREVAAPAPVAAALHPEWQPIATMLRRSNVTNDDCYDAIIDTLNTQAARRWGKPAARLMEIYHTLFAMPSTARETAQYYASVRDEVRAILSK